MEGKKPFAVFDSDIGRIKWRIRNVIHHETRLICAALFARSVSRPFLIVSSSNSIVAQTNGNGCYFVLLILGFCRSFLQPANPKCCGSFSSFPSVLSFYSFDGKGQTIVYCNLTRNVIWLEFYRREPFDPWSYFLP